MYDAKNMCALESKLQNTVVYKIDSDQLHTQATIIMHMASMLKFTTLLR